MTEETHRRLRCWGACGRWRVGVLVGSNRGGGLSSLRALKVITEEGSPANYAGLSETHASMVILMLDSGTPSDRASRCLASAIVSWPPAPFSGTLAMGE